ncbi:uncharacterized protein LOC142597693 [Dermatophagoides farinae]|nr:Golgi SNAP receptor complex member 2, variant 2 [Dermatophagoides farinae]
MNPNSVDSIRNYVDQVINKSFLILDQIHESYFPFLEKSIHLSVKSMVEKIDKAKISKTEFIIQQRIRHVLQNCEQLELIIEKLPATDPCKIDLLNRIDQLRSEQKRIWSAFKAIQFKRIEKERLKKEQEESLTRRFTSSTSTTSTTTNENSNRNDHHHQCLNHQHLSLNIDDPNNHDDDDHHQYSPTSKDRILSTSTQLSLPLSSSSSSTCAGAKLLRNQRPLVKRVRTRYLNFISNDFLGITTKTFLRSSTTSSCAEWILLMALCLIFIGLFFLIIWQTSMTNNNNK